MTSHPGISVRHVNAYHHNHSLLFQFILVAFIESFEEIQKIDNLCSRKLEDKHTPVPDQKRQVEISFSKLVGSSRDYMRLFSWNFGDGLLAKLKTHCALFLQNATADEREIIAMQHYAEKIWQACLQANDLFVTEVTDRTTFLAALEKGSTAIHRLSKVIARVILQFRDDENVVFCILQHHRRLDKIFGGRFVAKLLGKMYTKGLKEAQQVISKRYLERSFENIPRIAAEKIAEIEAGA